MTNTLNTINAINTLLTRIPVDQISLFSIKYIYENHTQNTPSNPAPIFRYFQDYESTPGGFHLIIFINHHCLLPIIVHISTADFTKFHYPRYLI